MTSIKRYRCHPRYRHISFARAAGRTHIDLSQPARDTAMDLSLAAQRPGFDGPSRKRGTSIHPPRQLRSVDRTDVFDDLGLLPIDATHHYYRRSKTVRANITELMADVLLTLGVSWLSSFRPGA